MCQHSPCRSKPTKEAEQPPPRQFRTSIRRQSLGILADTVMQCLPTGGVNTYGGYLSSDTGGGSPGYNEMLLNW